MSRRKRRVVIALALASQSASLAQPIAVPAKG